MSEWVDGFSDDDDEIYELIPDKPATVSRSAGPTKRKRKIVSCRATSDETDGLWLNKYKPKTSTQVVGNKAKISQLRDWVEEFLMKDIRLAKNKILLITGSSGCGKTAAIEAIAEELGCSIVQWNSEYSDYVPLEQRGDNSIEYQSQGVLFDHFLNRATKYRTLPLSACPVASELSQQIVCIEDIPSVYMKAPAEWHNKLRLFNKSTRHLVVIIFNTSGAVTERAMFPDTLQSELGIKHVAFNPVPKTDIKRLLSSISDNEKTLNIPKEFIASLSESCDGDIRTAVNTLQFTFSNQQQTKPLSLSKRDSRTKTMSSMAGKARGKRKGDRNTGTRSTMEVDEGDDFRHGYQKDPSLIIFRALGKVLYCKREESQDEVECILPSHLRHHVRCRMSFAPEQVFEQSKVSADYYTLCLHQNFPQFVPDLENAKRATDYLSHSDCLTDQFTSRNVTGKATVGVSIAARGLMHSNTSLTNKHGWVPLRKPYWFSARKRLVEHQSSMKWQNNTIYSGNALSTDIIPSLHMMRAKSPLVDVIPPLPSSHRSVSNYDRLDDKYGKDDVLFDLELSMKAETTADAHSDTEQSNEDKTPEVIDDPAEFLIEPVD